MSLVFPGSHKRRVVGYFIAIPSDFCYHNLSPKLVFNLPIVFPAFREYPRG